MTSKIHTAQTPNRLVAIVLFMVVFYLSAAPTHVEADKAPDTFPNLNTFIKTVQNGNALALRGVYIEGVMAYRIVQQPQNNSRFISTQPAVVTEFSMAARAGNIGLLAHNTLAGKAFQNIGEGDRIIVIYGNGHTETFAVKAIHQYQALSRGMYKDLETRSKLDTGELFDIAYGGKYHLTLQTCIENKGDANWGRLFIIAEPVIAFEDMPVLVLQDGAQAPLSISSIGWPLRTRGSEQQGKNELR
jgi:hypothetical protein